MHAVLIQIAARSHPDRRAAARRATCALTTAPTLELLAADREGLSPLLTERNAVVAAAHSTTQHAKGRIEMARIVFDRLEAKRFEAALCERAEQLGQLLADTIDALRVERGRLGGGRPPWTPSRVLMDRPTPLDLGRAW